MYTDDQYIKGVRSGDRELFAALVKQHLDPMVRFALRIIGSNDIAHDIVQDVFVSVWSKGNQWNPKSSVAAYLFAAVRNRAINQLTVDKNRQRIERTIINEIESSSHEDPSDPALLHNLNEALGLLTDRQQQAIHLRYYQGLTVQEVAEVLSIDIRATRRLLSRSISVLQANLADAQD